MKRSLLVFSLLVAATASAQRGPGPSPLGQLEQFEADVRAHTVMLKRDAFILSQAVAAVAALEDFQPNTAIQKALDRIDAAQLRAGEKPIAPPLIMRTLGSMQDDLLSARQQGSMFDKDALKRTLLRRSRDIQALLFRELDEIRRERQTISDLQTRVARLSTEVDDSVGVALAATIDSVRAAGN